ncbi:hypothetical protein [Pseudolysinimonas sp.]|uniref:hypothetical protein n=1 Tax=Pseudolysinimonas sp. TaxID=2680009 RepID=UPI003F7E5F32
MPKDRGLVTSAIAIVVALSIAIVQSAVHLGTGAWRPMLDGAATFLGFAALAGAINLALLWWVRSASRRVKRKHPEADVWLMYATSQTRAALRSAGQAEPIALGWGFVGADRKGFFLCSRDGAVLLGVCWPHVLDVQLSMNWVSILAPVKAITATIERHGQRTDIPIGLGRAGIGGIGPLQWGRGGDRMLARWQELRESREAPAG